ncbi:MAG: 3-keto-disaccharide hydrolase [Planctomycetota bacterium]|jgi:hypothetical protein
MIRTSVRPAGIFVEFVMVCCLLAASAAAQDDYVALFNGKDLSGWSAVGTPDAFVVKDGTIYCTGARPYPSWLRTEKQYENFLLRFEYKTQGWYEGGILFHAPLHGPASKLGFKLHLRHDQKQYGGRSPGAIYDAATPLSIANLPSGQWNKCEVECNWPRLRVELNGTVIHEIDMSADESLKYRLRKGFIGIQNIGCRAYFRNIRIKPLPDKEKWFDLFASGMEGFRVDGRSDWQIRGDVLTGKGNDGTAITKKEFKGPFELQVWVRTIVNGNGGVLFNYGNRGVEVQCFNCPDSTNPTGSLYGIAPASRVLSQDEQWFLLQVFNNGPRAMVMVNGEKVCETDKLQPPRKGSIAFQQHTPNAVIHYRRARIRPLENF